MGKDLVFAKGMNTRELIRGLHRIGGNAAPVRRTGELRFSHPNLPATPRCNGRRKDAPKHIVDFAIAAKMAYDLACPKRDKGR